MNMKNILLTLYDFVGKLLDCIEKYKIFYCILEIIAMIFGLITFPVYIIILPLFFHFVIKNLYYFQFLPEIRYQYNNKLIILSIILGEEILSLVFLFPLMIRHYIKNKYIIFLN